MAAPEQIILSDFIKSVHQKLRNDADSMGPERAWLEHCKDVESLEKYASAMKSLAINHWDVKYKDDNKAASRVEWVYNFCKQYFYDQKLFIHRQRETEIANKMNLEINTGLCMVDGKIQILDVGSCYNPFEIYSCFDVTAVDIAPASGSVRKCDFLNVKVIPDTCNVNFGLCSPEIRELPKGYFHMVVFSLLLEYLPSPVQRHLCCEKAYDLLRTEGILIIITPDSKHVGANANIMKSWRFILAELGFSRIRYEKLTYLHCMVFRKSLAKEIAQRWCLLQNGKQFFNEIVIPQDFKKITNVDITTDTKSNCDITLFEELPCTTVVE